MREITSRQNPLVAEYRSVSGRRTAGQTSVLLDGAHVIGEALAAGAIVRSAAVARHAMKDPHVHAIVERLQHAHTDVVVVSDAVLKAMSPTSSPSGLVAIGELAPVALERAFVRAPQLVIIAFDVQDPGNAGALIRSADAFHATAVIFCGRAADPFGWKAVRGSMGSVFRLPVVGRADRQAAIDASRAAGLALLAAVPSGGRSVLDVDLKGPTAVLVGGEGPGLEASVVAAADQKVSIPMASRVESLNVSVAAALLVWEAARQRGLWQEADRHA